MNDEKLKKYLAPPVKVVIPKKKPEVEATERLLKAASECGLFKGKELFPKWKLHPWVENEEGAMRLCECQNLENKKDV